MCCYCRFGLLPRTASYGLFVSWSNSDVVSTGGDVNQYVEIVPGRPKTSKTLKSQKTTTVNPFLIGNPFSIPIVNYKVVIMNICSVKYFHIG